MQCSVTPQMFWIFRRQTLGGKSAVTGAPLPEKLEDCNPDVQADHYAQACYAMANYVISTCRLDNWPGPSILAIVPKPNGVTENRALEIRHAAFAQMLVDYGIARDGNEET